MGNEGRAFFNTHVKVENSRAAKDYEEHDIELSSYRPELEGTQVPRTFAVQSRRRIVAR